MLIVAGVVGLSWILAKSGRRVFVDLGAATESGNNAASRSEVSVARVSGGSGTVPERKIISLGEILAGKDFLAVQELYRRRLLALLPSEFAGELAHLLALTPDGMSLPQWSAWRNTFVRLLLERWAPMDPRGALDALLEQGDPNSSAHGALELWAATDPQAAWEWVKAAAPNHGGYLSAVLAAMVKHKKFELAGTAVQQTPALLSDRVGNLAANWSESDAKAASQWALSLPEPQRTAALYGFIQGIAGTDPEIAAEVGGAILRRVSDPAEIRTIATTVYGSLPEFDRATWVVGLAKASPGGSYDLALSQLARSSGPLFDSTESLTLLGAIENRSMAQAAAKYRIQQMGTSARVTLDIGALYLEGNEREDVLTSAAVRWAKVDPTAAAAYLRNSASLPEELRSRLQAAIAEY